MANPIPMGQRPNHGTPLTQAEYEDRIAALHASGAVMPTKCEEEYLRRAEMDLLIDYHLGVNFPTERRTRILQEHMRLNRLMPWRLLLAVLTHPFSPSDAIAKSQVRALARHLNDDELAALFDLTLEDVARLKG